MKRNIIILLLCLSQILILAACARDDANATEILLRKFDEAYNKNHTSLKVIYHYQIFSSGAILYSGDSGRNNSMLIGQYLDYFKFKNLTLTSESREELILQKPSFAQRRLEKISYPNASFYEINGSIYGNEYKASLEQTWCNNNSLFKWDSEYPDFIIENPGKGCEKLISSINPRWNPRISMSYTGEKDIKEIIFNGKDSYEFKASSDDFDVSESSRWEKTVYYDAYSFLPVMFSYTVNESAYFQRKGYVNKIDTTLITCELIQFDDAYPESLFESPSGLSNLTRCVATIPFYKLEYIVNGKNAAKELCRYALLLKDEAEDSVVIDQYFFEQNLCLLDNSCGGYGDQYTSLVCFSDTCVNAEIADTPLRVERGLMFRKSLLNNEGMLFTYKKEGIYPFWMKNTYIPLDIIWINKDLRIVHIEQGIPCGNASECIEYTPNEVANYVLEVNAGFVNANGLKIGDEVKIKFG